MKQIDRIRHHYAGAIDCFKKTVLVLGVSVCGLGYADEEQLNDMTLLDLMNVEMVSSSKFKQELSDVTAAAYVITEEDIKNAGVSNLPQLLSMVPGLFVAAGSANNWAFGMRGFNSVFSNKILVMIDGRSLFSPFFSGVFWEQVDLYLPDIERIEVIRGVGSTVWGANAVNGVINIITKSTLGNESAQMFVNKGTNLNYDAGIRIGAKVAEQSYARVYFKRKDIDSSEFTSTPDEYLDDSWSSEAVGGKWEHFAGRDSFLVSGDYIEQDLFDPMLVSSRVDSQALPIHNQVNNLSFQWQRQVSTDKAFTLSAQQQHNDRISPFYRIDDRVKNIEFDISGQYDSHILLMGVGARQHKINFFAGSGFSSNLLPVDILGDQPPHEVFTKATILSGYVQDEWRFAADHSATFGIKFESHHHDQRSVGLDYKEDLWLPTLRYRYSINDHSMVWAAVSHSARIPSIAEHAIQIPIITIPPGTVANPSPWQIEVLSSGNSEFTKETLLSFEVGYRASLNERNNIDITAYHNRYDNLRSFKSIPATCVASGLQNFQCLPIDKIQALVQFDNALAMSVNGVEITWQSRLSSQVGLSSSYSYLNQVLDPLPADVVPESTSVISPKHQFGLQLDWQMLDDLNLRTQYKFIGGFDDAGIEPIDLHSNFITEQHNVDVTAVYQLNKHWTVKLNVMNLFHQSGQIWLPEFPGAHTSNVERRFSIGLDVKF